MKKIKVALAGLGRIGKIHLNNLCKNIVGTGCYEICREKRPVKISEIMN